MTTDRNTCGKRSYLKKDAQTARNRSRKRGAILKVYHCPKCNCWHLTQDLVVRSRQHDRWRRPSR